MSFGLRILPAADNDVDETAAYIAKDSIEHAVRFYDSIAATYEMILKAPRRWPIYELTHPQFSDVRKRSILGFANYLVFYRIDDDTVEIIRVLHGARDLPALFEPM